MKTHIILLDPFLDAEELNAALHHINGPASVYEVNTFGNWGALVVGPRGLTRRQAQRIHDNEIREMAKD